MQLISLCNFCPR